MLLLEVQFTCCCPLIGEMMIDPSNNVMRIEIIPRVRVVSRDLGAGCHVVANIAVNGRLRTKRGWQAFPITLANDNYTLAFSILLADKPAIAAVLAMIGRLTVTAEVCNIDLDALVDAAELITFNLTSRNLA